MKLYSWGRYPIIDNKIFKFDKDQSLRNILKENDNLIPYGNGRSYGDSALSKNIIYVKPLQYFLDFNVKLGLLHVQAGVLLSDILDVIVPKGWFLKVTPGTKLITVGGAIASDVHGKNHHIEGCFSESIKEFRMMLPSGEVVNCSKELTPELFKATCGGQGLTGIILDVKLYLKKINSKYIRQTSVKTRNLKETFEAFEYYKDEPYSVAWIDCLAKKENIGRSILMVGDFMDDGQLDYKDKSKISVPFNFPPFALNKYSVKAFNWLYYHKQRKQKATNKVDIDTFFYPLDAVNHWNRIYGKNGFTQYQFILPKEVSYQGLEEILHSIAESGKGSFLAVLKLYGKSNENYLSFPFEGYSLALDFKIEQGLFELLDQLDKLVVQYKGRIYLAKDVRLSRNVFDQGYPLSDKFREFRVQNGMVSKLQSLQSERLGI